MLLIASCNALYVVPKLSKEECNHLCCCCIRITDNSVALETPVSTHIDCYNVDPFHAEHATEIINSVATTLSRLAGRYIFMHSTESSRPKRV